MSSLFDIGAWRFPNLRASRRVVGILAAIVFSGLSAIGALLTIRRLNGAFTAELPWPALVGIAVSLWAVVMAIRLSWRALYPLTAENHQTTWADQAIGWGGSTVLLLWGLGCCYPFSRVVDGFIWIPLIIAEQFWRQNFFDCGHPEYQVEPTGLAKDTASQVAEPVAEPEAADSCLQQVYRVREEDGTESVYATLVAEFAADQRNSSVHVGFCPPLEYLPEIEAEPCSGPPCQVKVVQAFAHGVRLDLRLESPAEEPFQLTVDLAARHPNGQAGAGTLLGL